MQAFSDVTWMIIMPVI